MQLHSIVLTYIIHHLIERREIPPIHSLDMLDVKLVFFLFQKIFCPRCLLTVLFLKIANCIALHLNPQRNPTKQGQHIILIL